MEALLHSNVTQNYLCFYDFSDFQLLPSNEQTSLLNQNTPLYIQLLIASYFGANNGYEQLCFLLNFGPGTHPMDHMRQATTIRYISLQGAALNAIKLFCPN